ncbi:MAG: mitochondrial fission ELM1 family protein [Parvularculaceae bacterium]
MSEAFTCWTLTDGRAGIENQALALAEAIARRKDAPSPINIIRKRISINSPWDRLPSAIWPEPFSVLSAGSDVLAPPCPELLIAAGRRALPFAREIGRRSDGATLVVATQAPRSSPSDFDLIVAPEHDGLQGANVFPILGAPVRVTPEAAARDAVALGAALGAALAAATGPKIAALVGGDSKAHRLPPARAREIAAALRALAQTGAFVMITLSRRTSAAAAAAFKALNEAPNIFLWDGAPIGGLDNPYFGMLGLADHVLVTADSVNMACDAAATGKPVHILSLPERPFRSAGKFARFHESLMEQGAARIFDGRLESRTYAPLREADRAAAAIVAMIRKRRPASSAAEGDGNE